jgi:hypothetical protein
MYAITNTAPKTEGRAVPWNKGKLLGQKPPLKLKEIWAVRIRLQLQPLRHDVDSSGRGGHGAQQCPRRGERDWTLSRYNTRRALHRRTRRASGPSPSRDEDDDGHAARALLIEVSALTFTGRPEQAIAAGRFRRPHHAPRSGPSCWGCAWTAWKPRTASWSAGPTISDRASWR